VAERAEETGVSERMLRRRMVKRRISDAVFRSLMADSQAPSRNAA
jgi:hypothetical protein